MTQTEFKCNVCDKVLISRQSLIQHKETVHDGVIYRCKICDAPIRSRPNMADHMKRMHGNEEFSCDKCNFRTKTRRKLKAHIGNVHSEKRFECKLCDSKYGFQFALTKHVQQVHAKTLPENERGIATCPSCDFKSKPWNVQKHIKQLHQKREKPGLKSSHKCEYCDKSYTGKNWKNSLSRHLFKYHRSKLNIENFKKKQCWACPDCEFVTIKAERIFLERHVKQRHKKSLGKVILQDIFPKTLETKAKETEFYSGEYFEPKEETITLKPENIDLEEELDISDSGNDEKMKNDERIHSYLCPIKSCTFVMSCYDETRKNKHIETHHGEIDWTGVSFIKL